MRNRRSLQNCVNIESLQAGGAVPPAEEHGAMQSDCVEGFLPIFQMGSKAEFNLFRNIKKYDIS